MTARQTKALRVGDSIRTPSGEVGRVAALYGDGTATVRVLDHYETYFCDALRSIDEIRGGE